MSTLDPMHKKPWICYWEETTSFYEINATLAVGQIGRERENNYYLKILPLWSIVSIDDFLCYENRISFLRWDCPKKPKWHSYQVYEIHMKFSPSQDIFDYNSIRKLNALCSLWQWNQAPRVTVSSYFINKIETFVKVMKPCNETDLTIARKTL
jgi:hypothetical protein